MPHIVEGLVAYEVTEDEVDKLENAGMIVSWEKDLYHTTALLWDDFGIEGERVWRLFDLLLDRKESRAAV